MILSELEEWDKRIILPEMYIRNRNIDKRKLLGFIKKNGYKLIPNYGQYADMDDSKCFEKMIIV